MEQTTNKQNEIAIYCDARDSFFDFIKSFHCSEMRDKDNQPIIQFCIKNTKFNVYADFTNTNLPKKVSDLLIQGCRPDFIFYDLNKNKILFLIEETSTAPVGNAQKQRLPRPIISYIEKIPFIYICPNTGVDQSQKMNRVLTGVFKQLKKLNPLSFITPAEFDIKMIINDILNNKIEKYIIKNMINLQTEFAKTKVSTKKSEYDKINDLISSVNSDKNCVNIFEQKGNCFLIKKSSNIAKFFNQKNDFILVFGAAWKPSGGYSDPFAGGLYSIGLLNKHSKSQLNVIIVSSHDCDTYDTWDVINKNNKMTQALELCDFLYDGNGNLFDLKNVKYYSKEKFKYTGDSESLATYVRHKQLFDNGEEIEFVQYPHGSWSSKDGKNSNKRDEKRPDILCKSKPNGIEVKYELSDVYKHLKKYGKLHDEYVYMLDDCNILSEYNNININKITY